jgi:hypothetical protein
MKVVQLLNWHGRLEEATAELKELNRRWPDDPMVQRFVRNCGLTRVLSKVEGDISGYGGARNLYQVNDAELRTLVAKAPAESHFKRPLLVDDTECDFLVAEAKGAETALLVFAASNDSVAMPLSSFDRYVAPLGVTAVYVKDFNRLRFVAGIRSLANDYSGTLAALRGRLADLGVKRVCTIGTCDGGYAAIRYGVELAAERILTFNAPTHVPIESETGIERNRNFMRRRLEAHAPLETLDLKRLLEKRRQDTRIELYYEHEDKRDTVYATHLSGLSGVYLRPWPGLSDLRLLRKVILASDDFCAALATLLGVARSDTGEALSWTQGSAKRRLANRPTRNAAQKPET